MSAIIKMLSSRHDGEVVNAARALGRILSKHGKDWNDLGSYLERWSEIAEAEPQPQPRPRPQPRPQTYSGGIKQPAWKRRSEKTNVDVDLELVRDQVEALKVHIQRMRKNSADFIEELEMKFEQYGERTFVSPAQADYVNTLWGQFVGRTRR
jgi:hypothetical protein